MKPYNIDGVIPTLKVALGECMNTDDLKKLAALTRVKLPTRKAELADIIARHLAGERLPTVWQGLDELQRAAVAEVVHSWSTQFLADRFRAKYGRDPEWGSVDKYGYHQSPSPLCFFFYGGSLPTTASSSSPSRATRTRLFWPTNDEEHKADGPIRGCRRHSRVPRTRQTQTTGLDHFR